jgi:hypothetical protein
LVSVDPHVPEILSEAALAEGASLGIERAAARSDGVAAE